MSSQSLRYKPHPFLREAILYAVQIPETVEWAQLESLLGLCGEVVWLMQSRELPLSGQKTWKVHFASVYHAEMALATVQGLEIPGTTPPCVLTLSHTTSLDGILPQLPIVAQYVRPSFSEPHPLQAASAQQLFEYYRPAGPLFLIHTNFDVGHGRRTCVIEFWDIQDAGTAEAQRHGLHPALHTVAAYNLRAFYPYGILITNIGPSERAADIHRSAGKQLDGTRHKIDVRQEGTPTCHCYISFCYRTMASVFISEAAGGSPSDMRIRYIEFEDADKPDPVDPIVMFLDMRPSSSWSPSQFTETAFAPSQPASSHQQAQGARETHQEKKEDAGRQAEIEEMTQSMERMKMQEEHGRREKALGEKRAQQAAEQRRTEAERAAREAQERRRRDEQERTLARAEAERREAQLPQAYRDAVARERARCAARDAGWAPWFGGWSDSRYISWFDAVSAEFDETRFGGSQPLTFASVPWPLLVPPTQRTLASVQWQAVEAFFAAAKATLDATAYKEMLEKAHRRFHPDKWRSRGLLQTVLDENLRKALEDAGNDVAQAITPLWVASKSAH